MDPLMHLTIPILILAIFGYRLSETLKYSFLAIIPDLFYYTSFHRNLSHSYIILVPVCFLLYLSTKNKRVVFICVVFLLSHPLMDLGGYTSIFYPYPNYFRIHAEITLNQTAFTPQPDFWLEISGPEDMEWVYTSYILQTSTSIIFILLFSIFILDKRQKIVKWVQDKIRA